MILRAFVLCQLTTSQQSGLEMDLSLLTMVGAAYIYPESPHMSCCLRMYQKKQENASSPLTGKPTQSWVSFGNKSRLG